MRPKDGDVVKIARDAQAFWVREVKMVDAGVWIGIVDNNTGHPVFDYGDMIAFVDKEVSEVWDKTPSLTVVK